MSSAEGSELPSIRDLLIASGLPASDCEDAAADLRFFVARDGAGLTGVAGLQVVGNTSLLRSVAVRQDRRRHGVGRQLVADVERAALQAGVRELVLLTETAAPYFQRLGYRPAIRDAMPPEVRATSQFASLCPASATCLSKSLQLRIYHNPDCGTSRNVLAILREAGMEPEVIHYLRTPPDRATLLDLLSRMRMSPRELLREKGTPYAELGLADPSLTDEVLIERMLTHPLLINRPIVQAPWGTKLCRPSETVREFLRLD